MSNYTFISKKPYCCFKLLVANKSVLRLFHFHLGYNDVSLVWIVNGKLYDLLFFKIK